MITTRQDIEQAITALSLAGKTLFIHSAIKSFGQLDGGPNTLLDPLIEAGCTLILPSFTYAPLCAPPADAPVMADTAYGGHRGAWNLPPTQAYDYRANDIEPSMGAIPRALLTKPARVRSQHPINSFVGIGPLAESILAQQTLQHVYGLYDDQPQAWVLTMGVSLTSVTPIHYGEQQAGRKLFQRWAQQVNPSSGEVETVLVAIGSCSNGFDKLQSYVQPIARALKVGASDWTLYPLQPLITRCKRAIQNQQSITHCNDDNCLRCQDAIASATANQTVEGAVFTP